MEPGKRQHLQDIYATDRSQADDFTPQVSQEMLEERKREIRRHQTVSFILGMTILFLGVALVYVVVREYLDIERMADAPAPITQEYIPRYSLPTESQWVMDYSRTYADPTWNGEGERPFNSAWVKKAAFNIILAEQALEVKEYGKAAEHYENVLDILPDIEGVKVPLGMAYFQQEDFDRALVLLESASAGDLTHDILNNLGAACIEAKVYDKAEDYLNQALQQKPAYPEALKNQALLYRKMDRPTDAVSSYEKYLDLRPNDSDTRHTFALYLTKVGQWELASEQLYKLTDELKKDAMLFRLLAQVETRLGNHEAAMKALQRAIQLSDPSQAVGWMNEDEFDQLRGDEDFQALMRSTEDR